MFELDWFVVVVVWSGVGNISFFLWEWIGVDIIWFTTHLQGYIYDDM